MCAATVAYHRLMYSLVGHSPAIFRAYSTGEHSYSPSTVHQVVFPIICLATRWWKPSITFNIYPVTTYLLLPLSNTICNTVLYSIACACILAIFLINTFVTINHQRRDFRKFWYRATQSLLLNMTVWTKDGKAVAGSKGSAFTLIVA